MMYVDNQNFSILARYSNTPQRELIGDSLKTLPKELKERVGSSHLCVESEVHLIHVRKKIIQIL